ncbi:hypothetical protein DERP_010690 [Dermatophagoides pteronyssinus]|uniref:Uncharacterized protein n=1 Tax=Dermatophagoides pteronyssinus TaxID=6956 RepID=A0ABQ8JAR4_DERPT|nr:hypothetical protein DERP_010690 [Dermatophagoides pteronyssinus]
MEQIGKKQKELSSTTMNEINDSKKSLPTPLSSAAATITSQLPSLPLSSTTHPLTPQQQQQLIMLAAQKEIQAFYFAQQQHQQELLLKTNGILDSKSNPISSSSMLINGPITNPNLQQSSMAAFMAPFVNSILAKNILNNHHQIIKIN